MSISLQGSGGPKLLALYKGSTIAGLVPLGSSSTPIEAVTAPVIAGDEYRIAVDGSQVEHPLETWRGSFMGSFNVSIQLKAPRPCPAVGCGVAVPPPHPAIGRSSSRRSSSVPTSSTSRPHCHLRLPTAGATFVCKVDGKAYRACSSPFRVKGLRPGKHVFRRVATLGGTTSPSPGVVHFTVQARHRRHHHAR